MDSERLCSLVSELEIGPSCSIRVDDVESHLAELGIYGLRFFISHPDRNVHRINSEGRVRVATWHEVLIVNHINDPIVVDLDTSKRAYPIEQYKQECLIGEGYQFEPYEET